MTVIERFTEGKCTTTPSPLSEDAVVVTASYAAVIDGATPKTAFRYPSGETPGQLAARLLADAIAQMPPTLTALDATRYLTSALHQEEEIDAANRPIASVAIYSENRHEVWMIGDCQFAVMSRQPDAQLSVVTNPKLIDHQLASWRRSVIVSLLNRGVMTADEIQSNDPGRRIIQPFITRQVRFQNLDSNHPLAYGMLDGEPMPQRFVKVYPLGTDVSRLILATDGYPVLCASLAESEKRLHELLDEDPLCIGPLLGTKGIKPGCNSFDDRTYLSLAL